MPIPLFLILLSSFFEGVAAKCSMYGVCHETPSYFNYCPTTNSTRTPRVLPVEDEHLQSQLMLKCPYLFADGNRDLCCDSRQIEALFKMISIANSLFSRCPSCMDNFYKYWCMYTCSPNQSNFLKVLSTELSPSTNRSMVIKVQYDLSRQYAESTYNSCKDVQLGSSSGTAMLMMCGRLAANQTCTLERWLDFMGTRSHALGIPVDIIHKYHDASSSIGSFMHMNTTRCDQSPRPGLSRCFPSDCLHSSVSQHFFLEENVTQESCHLFGFGCSKYFLIFSIVVLFSIFAWAVFPLLFHKNKKDKEENEEINRQGRWIPKQIQLNTALFGEFVFRQPFLSILSGFLLIFFSLMGLLFLSVTSNPIEVWVPPNSLAIEEKTFFDSHFGPFYRVQQIIFYPKPNRILPLSDGIGPVFQKKFLREIFLVLESVRGLSISLSDGRHVVLDDICYRPMGSNHDCLINSPTSFFQHNMSLLEEQLEIKKEKKEESDDPFEYEEEEEEEESSERRDYMDHIGDCLRNPYTIESSLNRSCLAPWGGPTFPFLVFGGSEDPLNSSAIIVSIPLSSQADLLKMRIWESSFIKLLKKYKNEDVDISFMAERSIQDEIKRSSDVDAFVVSIAVLLMISYSIFILGTTNNRSCFTFKIRIFVGFCGILSIFIAILCSLGLLSFYGLRLPLASIVVSSFVVLVVGCNRVFSVLKTFNESTTSPGAALGSSLPSALVCSIVQSVVFCIGAFLPVPAVRCFCLLSALSVVFQFIFLGILFLPICVLSLKKGKKNCTFSCIKSTEEDGKMESRKRKESIVFEKIFQCILRPASLFSVLTLSLLVLAASPFAISKINLGLDQKLAVPTDSYMHTHFKNIERFLNVGPPVFFVVQGEIDFSKKNWQNKFCSLGGCEEDSIGRILSDATANPTKSYLTGEVLNWLDNYIEWLAPENQCCQVVFDSGDSPLYCKEEKYENSLKCESCDSFNADNRPSESVFFRHLKRFIEDVPGPHCVKGGRAAFHDAIHFDSNGHVDASHLMTFHVPLRNSSAYISAMTNARLVAKKIEDSLGEGVRVFPYSVFFIFYEQFTTIRAVSAYQLIFAFSVVFLSVFLLIGFDVLQSFILLSICCFQLIIQASSMALWSIDLNSISAVNLVLAVVLTIESSLPVLLVFNTSSSSSSSNRAEEAALRKASSSFFGLTITMILGTILLAFAYSPFFSVYFFRMLIVTALSGAFSSFVLLPVLLSIYESFEKRRKKKTLPPVSSGCSAFTELDENSSSGVSSPPSAPLLSTVL